MVRRSGRALVATAAVALATCGWASVLHTASAAADGDPASDVLLIDNVFYPYAPPTSDALQRQLNGATAAVAGEHQPLKVAIIASRTDLGTIPELLGKPQEYADFLDQEISFTAKQALLVVMADGYGTQGLKPAATAAIAALRKPAGGSSDQLAQAALDAIQKIAAADGHPLTGAGAATTASTGGDATVAIFAALVAVALAATAVVVTVTLRRRA